VHELAESVAALQDQLKDQQEAMGTILDMLDRSITVAVRADCCPRHAHSHIFACTSAERVGVASALRTRKSCCKSRKPGCGKRWQSRATS
jgi:hypothetical protein